MSPSNSERIPVILLSGFLGSGKTTLLNRLLLAKPRSAVIINEFGTTPIDQQLLREYKILLSVLSGGCLCCQVSDALIPVLKNLRMAWESRRTFDQIIIETSGVANPERLLDILLHHRWLSSRLNLQNLITTVSAVMDQRYFDDFPEVHAQIGWADTIVITKTDLATYNQIEQMKSRLDRWAASAVRLTATQGDIDMGALLAFSKRFRQLNTGGSIELPDHSFTSNTLRLENPISWEHLQKELDFAMARYREQLIRLKGMVYTPGENRPLLVQGALGRIYPPIRIPARSSDDGIGRLVFISHGEIKTMAEELMARLIKY